MGSLERWREPMWPKMYLIMLPQPCMIKHLPDSARGDGFLSWETVREWSASMHAHGVVAQPRCCHGARELRRQFISLPGDPG